MPLLRKINRSLDRLYLWCGYAAAALLVLLGTLVVASIVTRLAGVYISGLGAYSGYAMAGASFLALAYTFSENGHIRVALVLGHVHGRTRFVIQLWCLAAASATCAYLAFYLVKMTLVSLELGEVSESADATPLWIPQLQAAVGSVILAVCVLHNLIRLAVLRDEHRVSGAGTTSLET